MKSSCHVRKCDGAGFTLQYYVNFLDKYKDTKVLNDRLGLIYTRMFLALGT
jgi:hypothetical protein